MPEQSKFENMDLFASLEAIMKQNTGFYQSDLDIDKEIIAKAAASPHREDKTLLWFCRPSGTHCFRERDVFLKDTAPHNTWRFYMEQTSDRVLAYAIELTGKERGKIKGNLYELDYSKHYERVKEKELTAYADRLDAESQTQFSAIMVKLEEDHYCVAYRGTDNTLIGWKEDFNMGFVCPVPGQKLAVDYLQKAARRLPGRLTVCGHSKGGNFAVYAAAFCGEEI